MISPSSVIHALSTTEIVDLAWRLEIDLKGIRSREKRLAAIAQHAALDMETIIEGMRVSRLKELHRALRLPVLGRTRKLLHARLIGHEAELGVHCEPYNTWVARMEEFVRELRPESHSLSIHKPATEREVVEIESHLGLRLPEELRTTLRKFSRQFSFYWHLDRHFEPPASPYDEIFWGGCEIGIETLKHMNYPPNLTVEALEKPDSVWSGKLLVIGDGSGNAVAIDFTRGSRMTYLDHDDSSPPHGALLGSNFLDFMDKFTRLGCVGPDIRHLRPFLGKRGLRTTGPAVRRYQAEVRRYGSVVPKGR